MNNLELSSELSLSQSSQLFPGSDNENSISLRLSPVQTILSNPAPLQVPLLIENIFGIGVTHLVTILRFFVVNLKFSPKI